jgi:nitrite reductase/ring-hydroxylating ferredoxin subunit
MSSARIGQRALLPPGSVAEVEIGGRTIALCNVAGELFAVDGICPHAGGRLGHGALHGYWLVCPWHGWEFDCRTGEQFPGSPLRLETWPVECRGDDILLDIGA